MNIVNGGSMPRKSSLTQHIHQQLATLPVALTGLALGIAGLTGALKIILGEYIAFVGVSIASILVLMITMKNILHGRVFLSELAHPILGSFIPTLAMALMVIASTLLHFMPVFSKGIWLFAIVFHCIILVQFFRFRIQEFSMQHVIPSWFVPPVGIVVACVTSVGMGFPKITFTLFYIGIVAYGILLPIMLYRIMFGDRLTDAQIPTFAIMGAPANLCLAGLLTIFPEANIHIVQALAYLCLFTTLLVYIFFIRIFQIPFSPSYSALTFPLAIGATAMLKYSAYLKSMGIHSDIVRIWSSVAYIELCIASAVISYVFVRIVIFLYTHFSLEAQ